MLRYAKKDTAPLEPLFTELPLDQDTHPVGSGDNPCRNCDSGKLVPRGVMLTLNGTYPRFCCLDCGNWFRGSTRVSPSNMRDIA